MAATNLLEFLQSQLRESILRVKLVQPITGVGPRPLRVWEVTDPEDLASMAEQVAAEAVVWAQRDTDGHGMRNTYMLSLYDTLEEGKPAVANSPRFHCVPEVDHSRGDEPTEPPTTQGLTQFTMRHLENVLGRALPALNAVIDRQSEELAESRAETRELRGMLRESFQHQISMKELDHAHRLEIQAFEEKQTQRADLLNEFKPFFQSVLARILTGGKPAAPETSEHRMHLAVLQRVVGQVMDSPQAVQQLQEICGGPENLLALMHALEGVGMMRKDLPDPDKSLPEKRDNGRARATKAAVS